MPPVDSRLYDLLQIPTDASDRDIKRTYRKLAMKYHPDKNNGDPVMADKFKDITAAYEILSSPEKRARYDEMGDDGSKNGYATDATSANETMFEFHDMFDDERNIRKSLMVTLEELYTGVSKSITVTRFESCFGCHGRGYSAAAHPHTCKKCQGTGTKTTTKKIHSVMKKRIVRCFVCDGKGTFIHEKDICQECHGQGTVKTKENLNVEIKKGHTNSEIILKGQGHHFSDCEPGNVIVQVCVQEHPVFQVRGYDLYTHEKISFVEALTGFERVIKHLDGRTIVVGSPPGKLVSPNDVQVVHGEGMPINEKQKGNLFIEFDVEFPTAPITDPEKIKALECVFPKPKQPTYNDADVTKYSLKEPEIGDLPQEDTYSDGSSYYEDDGHVPCTQQ